MRARPHWAAYVALALAAGASLATSQPRWERKHRPITGTLTLTSEKPTDQLHFTLTSSHDQSATLELAIRRVGGSGSSQVWLSVQSDGATSPPAAPTALPSSRLAEPGKGSARDSSQQRCAVRPCTLGYTAHVALEHAGPGESAVVEWTMVASVEDRGDDKPPKGAFIRAVQDPLPVRP